MTFESHIIRGEKIMTDFTCGNFKELIFDYIDGELNAEDTDKFENHMKNCSGDCNEEFRRIQNMMSSVKESRYTIKGELYAALVPHIETESRNIKVNNVFRNARKFGSIGIAAMIMLVMLVYFMPISDIVNNSMSKSNQVAAEIAEDIQTESGEIEVIDYSDAPKASAVAVPGLFAMTSPEAELAHPSVMVDYLNAYAPSYADETEKLYISYNEVSLPEGVIADEVITQPECSVYVINLLSNSMFDMSEVTDYDTVYDTSETGKMYLVIIAFDSDEN
jgi:hypothetical protein